MNNMKKEERLQRKKATKEWCKDIMDKYLIYWPPDSKIYKNLYRFYYEDRVRGFINKKTSQRKKEEWLSSVAIEINQMYDELIKVDVRKALPLELQTVMTDVGLCYYSHVHLQWFHAEDNMPFDVNETKPHYWSKLQIENEKTNILQRPR